MPTDSSGPQTLRIIYASLFTAVTVGIGVELIAQNPDGQAVKTVTHTGCLVDEATFARASGLARVDAPARAGQFVLIDRSGVANRRPVFVITGTREDDLVSHSHAVVELTGVLESGSLARQGAPSSGVSLPPQQRSADTSRAIADTSAPSGGEEPTPSGAAGVTARGTAAHEPGDATTPSSAPSPQGVIAIADLPRLNVHTIRVVGGSCADSLRQGASVDVPQPGSEAPPAPAAPTPAVEKVTVTGCVLREADTGNAAASPPTGALLLTRASRSQPRPAQTSGGAVPGSLPSGSGTGTVAPRDHQARMVAPDTPAALTFELDAGGHDLSALVGQAVSIDGTLRAAAAVRQTPSAHSTAPSGTLRVESVRSIPGDCR